MSERDPLAEFEPRVVDGRLVLTLRRIPPVTVGGTGTALVCLLLAVLWGSSAPSLLPWIALALAALAAVVALASFVWNRAGSIVLELGRDGLRWNDLFYVPWRIDGISVEGRSIGLWHQAKLKQSVHHLRHDSTALSALRQVLQGWRDDPAWDPERPLQAAPATGTLQERLAVLQPTLDFDHFAIQVRKRWDLTRHPAKVNMVLIAGMILGNLAGMLIIVALLALVWRLQQRGTCVIGPTGIAVEGHWRTSWTQVRAATLGFEGDVQIHLVDGSTHTVFTVRPEGAAALVRVITERARPDGSESDVPAMLIQARSARLGESG